MARQKPKSTRIGGRELHPESLMMSYGCIRQQGHIDQEVAEGARYVSGLPATMVLAPWDRHGQNPNGWGTQRPRQVCPRT
jgi:hypothetical protein